MLSFYKHTHQKIFQNVTSQHSTPYKMQLTVKNSIQNEQIYTAEHKFAIPLQCNRKGN